MRFNLEEKILILNFGTSYNQFLIQKIRALGVYAEMVDYDIKADDIKKDDIKKDKSVIGIILSGSPRAVYAEDGFLMDREIYNLDIPILGICYGMQLMAHQLGGKVRAMGFTEKGKVDLIVDSKNSLLSNSLKVYMNHGDHVVRLPKGFTNHGHTKETEYALMTNAEKKLYGTQFHPEKDNSGVLETFILDICKAKKNWNLEEYLDVEINNIRKKVKEEKVILALSAGFKSTLSAVILKQAIGDQLICISVDHGLMLEDEPRKSLDYLKNHYSMNIVEVDAKERFLKKLQNVYDPEEKRKIIGKEYIEIFKEVAERLKGVRYLAQGTIYSDVLDSKDNKTGKFVKSHHNVGALPEDNPFILIEPLRELFKDEARKLAELLNLDKSLIYKQSFPGEGLAIRIIGNMTKDKIEIVRKSDKILKDEIKKAKLDKRGYEHFTILTDTKSVGSNYNERTYEYVLAIRAVKSEDRMSASIQHIPYDVLESISKNIIKEVEGVNRIVYDISAKPSSTIEWE